MNDRQSTGFEARLPTIWMFRPFSWLNQRRDYNNQNYDNDNESDDDNIEYYNASNTTFEEYGECYEVDEELEEDEKCVRI